LKLLPPDSYFVVASWAEGESRQEYAKQLVESWARVAGARMESEERQQLEGVAASLARAREGWLTFALRPALEPGPLVALVVIETRDSNALIDALVEGAALLAQGYLQSALDHLGARVTLTERRRGEGEGELRFEVTPPEDISDERGSVLRVLTGPSPSLTWRALGDDRVVLAFGPDSSRELSRLAEASDGAASSILTQPVLSRVFEASPGAGLFIYALPSALGSLLTRGGPAASGLSPDGLAAATSAGDGEWQATIHVGPEQVGSLIEALSSEDES